MQLLFIACFVSEKSDIFELSCLFSDGVPVAVINQVINAPIHDIMNEDGLADLMDVVDEMDYYMRQPRSLNTPAIEARNNNSDLDSDSDADTVEFNLENFLQSRQ